MNPRKQLFSRWRSAIAGGLLCAGLAAGLLAIGGWPVCLSYDLLFLFRNENPPDDAVIVFMDDLSFKELKQTSSPNWDRNLHAQLLDRLTADQARVVVFDIVFSEPGTPEANSNLVRAIRDNGRVVLAAALNHPSRAQIALKQPLLPLPEFLDAAAGWGIAEVDLAAGPGRVVRQYHATTPAHPSLPQVAARIVNSQADDDSDKRWINYYGPPLTIPHVSYCELTNQAAGFFRDKCVFVGARPTTLKAGDEADQFRTPHTLWTGDFMPGVEIGATEFLNLINGHGIGHLSRGAAFVFVIACGALFGAAIGLLRPPAALALAIGAAPLMLLAGLQAAPKFWLPWTPMVLAQAGALAWALRSHFFRLQLERDVLERALAETSRRGSSIAAVPGTDIVVPDHTLVRRVGKGAYGEVWLARNAIGAFHAVKIVRRNAFPADEPYEREFKGVQKFMPISRSHPGLVHVLHVGRNNDAGFFYCVMEAADDRALGQKIVADSYEPRSLAGELASHKTLSPQQCLQLGIQLSAALEHLHQQRLIHRDIKPGNIIFVNGAPKFADIGLVTDQGTSPRDVSMVGTEGYIPPEGPGTPAGDVYALGKVLYEACMGRDRRMFPEVPTSVWEQPDESLLKRLNTVIGKACETDPKGRFQSAAELHAALMRLQQPA